MLIAKHCSMLRQKLCWFHRRMGMGFFFVWKGMSFSKITGIEFGCNWDEKEWRIQTMEEWFSFLMFFVAMWMCDGHGFCFNLSMLTSIQKNWEKTQPPPSKNDTEAVKLCCDCLIGILGFLRVTDCRGYQGLGNSLVLRPFSQGRQCLLFMFWI